MPPLVLASTSPQRRAILERLGVEFEVAEPDAEELGVGDARELVVENALRKGRSVAHRLEPGRLVLAVDTAVVLAGRVYGKPRGEPEARSFLQALSGREHQVWSGIALLESGRAGGEGRDDFAQAGGERLGAACTDVRFRRLSRSDLAWYLSSGDWRDRAGGYAIQGRGAALVERVAGDPWNVVGLPVAELMRVAPELVPSGGRSRVR